MTESSTKYIILTRPVEQSQKLHDVLRAEGIKSVIFSMLTCAFLEADWPKAEGLRGLVVTSARSIEAMIHADVLDRYTDIPCFCVGGDTAQLAKDTGFQKVHIGIGGARNLEALIRASVNADQGALFYPSARDVSYPLADKLRDSGFMVLDMEVYTMERGQGLSGALITALQDKGACITFYSARTAQNFVELVQEENIAQSLAHIKVLCISASVLECVQQLTWASTHTAQTPDGSGMLESIKRICRQ